jgi:hypothetical protein
VVELAGEDFAGELAGGIVVLPRAGGAAVFAFEKHVRPRHVALLPQAQLRETRLTGGRADQTAIYFHRADEKGVGVDRTVTGSSAIAQYASEVGSRWADLATCPDEFLLGFPPPAV